MHSTELAALELIDKIATKMDNNEVPINIYLDLSKAFDTLDPEILLYRVWPKNLHWASLLWG